MASTHASNGVQQPADAPVAAAPSDEESTTGQASPGGQHAHEVRHGRVVSDVPGRLRIRMRHPRHAATSLHRAESHLNAHPDVDSVATNPVTGSMVVHYDPAQQSTGDILALLRDVGVIVADVAHAGDESVADIAGELSGEEAGPVGHSRTALTMVDAVDDLNARLHRFTGGLVDLKLLFPLSMGAIGVAKLLRDGWQLSEIPAYVLLWYAFDAFYKLHRQPPDQLATTAQVKAAAESASPNAPLRGMEAGGKERTATGGATAGG